MNSDWSRVTYCVVLLLFCGTIDRQGMGQDRSPDRGQLHEPVFRVAKQPKLAKVDDAVDELPTDDMPESEVTAAADVADAHPLDEVLKLAKETLDHIDSTIDDYTCTLVKREHVNGKLLEHEFITCKIRHARQEAGRQLPFSVYLGFRRPDSVQGREVIFSEGQNDGKLVAHEGGFKGRFIPTVYLEPNSPLAMRGNKYPITEIGIRTLTLRLIEKGERDKKLGPCSVRILHGAKVKDRVCTCVEVKHVERRPQYDFHLARIFMDDELRVPIRYEAFGWPTSPNAHPGMLEEYSYTNLKLNVGLTDKDFDPNNEKYNF